MFGCFQASVALSELNLMDTSIMRKSQTAWHKGLNKFNWLAYWGGVNKFGLPVELSTNLMEKNQMRGNYVVLRNCMFDVFVSHVKSLPVCVC